MWFIRGTWDACYRPQYQTSDPSVVFNNIVHLSHLCSSQTLSYKLLVWLHSSLILFPKFVTPRAHWRHLQFKYPRLHSEYGFSYFKNKSFSWLYRYCLLKYAESHEYWQPVHGVPVSYNLPCHARLSLWLFQVPCTQWCHRKSRSFPSVTKRAKTNI